MLKELLLIAEELADNGMPVCISYTSWVDGIELELNGQKYQSYLKSESTTSPMFSYYHRDDLIEEIRKVRNEWMNDRAHVTEDKQAICNELCKTLKLTDSASDLLEINYIKEKEVVEIVFRAGVKTVNVACDSGSAMIKDILKSID